MVIWTDGNRSDYFLPLENLVNHLNGKYRLSPRPSSSPRRPLLTTLKNLVPSELDYVKKKINRKKLREYTKIWTMIILANSILGDLTSFIRFSIFQAFYNVCAFPLKSDVNFLNIDTFILICHVFTLTLKNIHNKRPGSCVLKCCGDGHRESGLWAHVLPATVPDVLWSAGVTLQWRAV